MGTGTLKLSRYLYSILEVKSSSVPVLGTHFKKYRITLAVLGTFLTLIKLKIPIFVLAGEIKSATTARVFLAGT